MSTVQNWVRTACALVVLIAAAAILPATASAADGTTWICKPGQADDLCAGTIEGNSNPPPGEQAEPLGYTRPDEAPVDCFYLYPTQSEQTTPNSNLDKDPPIRRVVVQQARMFSTVCDVYAPMYRQVTLNGGNQAAYNPSVETAYRSAKSAFKDYLQNYNDGRGFIMLGHSQGSAHTARLIQELVDTNEKLRSRFVGAIAPGANIPVPIGEPVGGLFDNVPACTRVGQYGCVTAFSTYNDVPPANSEFARVDAGYWIYPQERFDAGSYEVMCTNPARLDGGDGTLLPLVDFDYLSGVPAHESAAPWGSQPDYYKVRCRREAGAHWLNLSKVGIPGDNRPDLGSFVASGSNYHVPEVNLAEGNLLRIAQLQTDSYEAEQARIGKVKQKLASLREKVAKQKNKRAALATKAKKLEKKAAKADSAMAKHAVEQKLKDTRRRAKAAKAKIESLQEKIAKVKLRLH